MYIIRMQNRVEEKKVKMKLIEKLSAFWSSSSNEAGPFLALERQ